MSNWNDVIAFASRGNPKPPKKVEKTDQEGKAQLSREVCLITREKCTERAHSSALCNLFEPEIYQCACCETPLFDSLGKFHRASGWPSFKHPIEVENVAYHKDTSHGMIRVETTCNICDAHLGHVFPDGPALSGPRYCINAFSLKKI
jgi:peptide-methionine (R)-S-oxide reductase